MGIFSRITRRVFVCTLIILLLVAAGAYEWYVVRATEADAFKTQDERDVYVRFDMEAYDLIGQNYWKKATDTDLAQLFQLALQKAANMPSPPINATMDRAGTARMLGGLLSSATTTEAKKQLALAVVSVAIYNLPPAGRNALLSSVQETKLRQEVSNVKPESDLYGDLGLKSGASGAEVAAAYKREAAALAHATSTEDKQKLEKITHAFDVLAKPLEKKIYDQAKVEPTLRARIIGETLYIYMEKIAPATLLEFAQAVDHASTTRGMDSMIIDMRGNIGGDLAFFQNLYGVFVGKDQYAFDLFQQGEYLPQRTTQPKYADLDPYREIAILTDGMTQSTAEVIAASLKRFNRARTVGTQTRGWGTVENTYPLTTVFDPAEKYALLIAHSLTLRDDNQPIEGRGVDPDVDITKSDWRAQLGRHFTSRSLIAALRQIADKPPLK